MSIILRTLKGSALTYEEMDRNLSQYFYSSSVHDSGTELRLHFTGSDSLDTVTEDYGPDRYHSVTIGGNGGGVSKIIAGTGVTISPVSGVGNVTINASGAAGNNPGGSAGSIQYKINDTTFGGNTDLFYLASDGTNLMGLGTNLPQNKLHIVGNSSTPAVVRVATDGSTGTNAKAQMSFYSGTTKLGEIGKTVAGSTADSVNMFLQATNKLRFQIASSNVASVTSTGVGIFDITPNRQLVVLGEDGIGIQKGGTRSTQSIIRPIVASVYSSGVLGSSVREYGVMISPPLATVNSEGGHVVVSLSKLSSTSDSDKNSFSIISSRNEAYASATSVACFRADSKVGIATNNPQVTLDVNGQIRGKFTTNASDTAALGIDTSKVVKAPITGDITFTATVAPAGTEAKVIIVPSISTTNTVTFSSTYFYSEGTLTVSKSRVYVVSFVSDGTKWYESSRTSHLS